MRTAPYTVRIAAPIHASNRVILRGRSAGFRSARSGSNAAATFNAAVPQMAMIKVVSRACPSRASEQPTVSSSRVSPAPQYALTQA